MVPESAFLRLAERLVTGCPSAALLIEPGGRLRIANPAARGLLGLHEGGGVPVRDLLGIGWREIEVIARDGETDLVAELPDRRSARIRLEPVPGEDGHPAAVVAFLQPVARLGATARRGARRELGFDAIFGTDEAVVATREAGARFARTELPILLLAETGTGKELLARAIHGASARHDKPFVAINCGALSPHLLESELFGYAPGAFTGASREGTDGKIGAARGGTLFLDEVAEMPAHLQALLLRVLEDGTYYRVGENRPRHADVRLICATCRDLPRLVAEGTFREDLFYRINGACLGLPPVRARRDVDDLIRHLLSSLVEERGGTRAPGLSPAAFERMMALSWPGNVRQLKTALQYALILSDGGEIRPEHLPQDLVGAAAPRLRPPAAIEPAPPVPTADDGDRPDPMPAPRTLAALEAARLENAVESARGNLTRAAAELGIARSTLYRRLRRHGLLP